MPSKIESETSKANPKEEEHQEARESTPPPDPRKKRRNLAIGAVVVIVLAIAVFASWMHSSTYENTDDAQVDGHINPIASRIAGTVKAVYVENHQFVKEGQPLVDLDTTDSQITLDQSRAQLDASRAQLAAERPNVPITLTSNASDAASSRAEVANAAAAVGSAEHDYQSDIAQLQQAEANAAKAQNDLARYQQLIDKHEVAQADYDQYAFTAKAQAATVASQKALVAAAARTIEQKKAQLNEQQAKLRQTIVNGPRQILIKNANLQQQQASLESAAAQVRQNEVNLSYCHIVSPVSGLITQRTAEIGARLSVGQQLMLVIQTGDLWVTANFKETQLKNIRVGQRATLEVDSLDKTFEGYVEYLAAASGDRTSALPPENATGNYVKVVQRLPLRIRFRPNQEGLAALRPGMSVTPKVFVK